MDKSIREEIERNYRVVDGTIRDFGQFEGEPVWCAAYWQCALEGFCDEEAQDLNGYTNYFFDVTPEDRVTFPEIPEKAKSVCVWQNDNGFVIGAHHDWPSYRWAEEIAQEADEHLGPVCENCSERTDHQDFCPHCDAYNGTVEHLEEMVRDGDCIKVDDTGKVPTDYSGLVMQVSDHGNVELYRATNGALVSIWSCV